MNLYGNSKNEKSEDLGLLLQGDVVLTRDCSSRSKGLEKSVFYREDRVWHFEFILPAETKKEYIIINKIRKSKITSFDNGIVSYYGDECSAETVSQDDSRYLELDRIIHNSGLR